MINQLLRISFLSLCLFVLPLPLYSAEQKPPITSKKLEPNKTIIAFDIDEVVLAGREAGYKKWLANNPDLAQAIDQTKKKFNLTDATAIINKTAQEFPALKEKAQEFQKIVVSAPRITGTAEILKKLEQKGYGIVAASNMTTSTYQAMVNNGTLPPQFSNDFFFVATNELNKKPDGTYFEKPSLEYYQNLGVYINQKYPGKYVYRLFTDDKEKNAQGAQKAGLISIHFKNAEQLLEELKELNIDIE